GSGSPTDSRWCRACPRPRGTCACTPSSPKRARLARRSHNEGEPTMTVVNAIVLLLGIGLGAGAIWFVGRLRRRRLAELDGGAPGGRGGGAGGRGRAPGRRGRGEPRADRGQAAGRAKDPPRRAGAGGGPPRRGPAHPADRE